MHLNEPVRPIIGISTGELFNLNRPKDSYVYGQLHYYNEVIEHAGGAALLIPSTDNKEILDAVYAVMDGVLLAGGNDVDPLLYGEEPHEAIEGVSIKRDITEMHLAKRAQSDKKPMLAICRGAQLWNVSEGGSLFQHLPDVINSDILHANPDKHINRLHSARVEPGSLLADILLSEKEDLAIQVNSYHHQAVNRLGRNLKAVAWADDGVIEAIESETENWFAIGVQWHPETMGKSSDLLFQEFITASVGFTAGRPYKNLSLTA